ncbi:hypothetical protein HYV11_01025 [Candidatus Dependentiae bacterium]|nr:hypothetical protein [Candidatus Dependentiae bacterium]
MKKLFVFILALSGGVMLGSSYYTTTAKNTVTHPLALTATALIGLNTVQNGDFKSLCSKKVVWPAVTAVSGYAGYEMATSKNAKVQYASVVPFLCSGYGLVKIFQERSRQEKSLKS